MNTIVILNSERVTISTAEEARDLRDSLLARVKSCPPVTNAETQEVATNLLRDLRNFYKAIEAGRQEAKNPVMQMGRQIDGLARELSLAVEEHGKALGNMLGAYDLEQKRIAEQKRQEAAAEELRIRREAERKEREEQERLRKIEEEARAKERARLAEIQRLADEKAARARTEAGRERAAAEALRLKAESEERAKREAEERERKAIDDAKRRDEEEARRVADTRMAAVVAVVKPKDTSTRNKPCFEITDIVALYEAAPFLVNMTPNTAALNSAIKNLRGEQTLPGVKHWFEASTITRG